MAISTSIKYSTKIEFPALLKSKSCIILATKNKGKYYHGTVVHVNYDGADDLGEYSELWPIGNFRPFSGIVEINHLGKSH